ncbi:antitoxin [Brenneria roseae subsp. roseae]|uniref:type II TA system antitoxin MqsA family protein n=1 Tax=Brenneria roseae TaxID=1509241 RepID=UPI000D619519|nr:type II TA system antitoxin MqsA family protein [Brenneria roseae]PWC16160.1 antitoxin [Brenneria roseae subsp. roseae]
MKCPNCGGAELVQGAKDVPYSFRGKKTVLPAIDGLHCTVCHEVIMNKTESAAYLAKIADFKNSVIAETVEPAYIVKVRKKLDLTQREASAIFGGGVNAFSRYEKGKAQPHPSTIKLLKVLDRHPELLSEIRN